MGTLLGKEECEFAALYLDVTDTIADIVQTNRRPYGCIYGDNDWLSWYNPEGSPYESALCGENDGEHDYDCICSSLRNNSLHMIL